MITKLHKAHAPLSVGSVEMDAVTRKVMKTFDIESPVTDFYPWDITGIMPDAWSCGLVVGASGTGKSTLLRELGETTEHIWEHDLAIAGHFRNADDAIARLGAVGLNSVPTWAKPYRVLSTGERFRADLARSLHDGAIIDEYTSTVSRVVAKAASRSMSSWVRRSGVQRMVLATCHYDVIDWLSPDWVIDTDAGTFTEMTSGDQEEEHWWVELVSHKDGEIGCDSKSTD